MKTLQSLDIQDDISLQIAPLRVIADYMDALAEEAGRQQNKHIEMGFSELFPLGNSLRVIADNIEQTARGSLTREIENEKLS
jgi:hypothetical protein